MLKDSRPTEAVGVGLVEQLLTPGSTKTAYEAASGRFKIEHVAETQSPGSIVGREGIASLVRHRSAALAGNHCLLLSQLFKASSTATTSRNLCDGSLSRHRNTTSSKSADTSGTNERRGATGAERWAAIVSTAVRRTNGGWPPGRFILTGDWRQSRQGGPKARSRISRENHRRRSIIAGLFRLA
jgi:hypothetical protein